MPPTRTIQKIQTPSAPEDLGPSLAHVVKIEAGREHVLGQAWVAAANTLVTCGHVVEPFVQVPASVVVKFPFSGNFYAIKEVKLHPQFMRLPDQLVKYDLAVLTILMVSPETEARALPFSFEEIPELNESLATVRYPVHLGQIAVAPVPLMQEGKLIGRLQRHDNLHLLHDLPLSPGDSGAPLFHGGRVVALHCGDTATLPGLNLPTTSIRLCLSVAALQDLAVGATVKPKAEFKVRPASAVALVFLLSLFISLAGILWLYVPSIFLTWSYKQPAILPVTISFNKPIASYKKGDPVQVAMVPSSGCFLYLLAESKSRRLMLLYPPGALPAWVNAGDVRTVHQYGKSEMRVDAEPMKLHVVALSTDYKLVRESDLDKDDPEKVKLNFSADELNDKLAEYRKLGDSSKLLHVVLDAPVAL